MNTECHFIHSRFSTGERDTRNKDTTIFHFHKSVCFVQFCKNSSTGERDAHSIKYQILWFCKLYNHILITVISGNSFYSTGGTCNNGCTDNLLYRSHPSIINNTKQILTITVTKQNVPVFCHPNSFRKHVQDVGTNVHS